MASEEAPPTSRSRIEARESSPKARLYMYSENDSCILQPLCLVCWVALSQITRAESSGSVQPKRALHAAEDMTLTESMGPLVTPKCESDPNKNPFPCARRARNCSCSETIGRRNQERGQSCLSRGSNLVRCSASITETCGVRISRTSCHLQFSGVE